jgi:hypothetical protein
MQDAEQYRSQRNGDQNSLAKNILWTGARRFVLQVLDTRVSAAFGGI